MASCCSAMTSKASPADNAISPAGTMFCPPLRTIVTCTPPGKSLHDFIKSLAGEFLAEGNLAHVKALRFRREFRLHHCGHEIDAQDRTDDPERIGDRISDRRLVVVHDIKRRLQRRGACHRAGKDAERVADLDPEDLARARARRAGRRRTAINASRLYLRPAARHSFKELPPVKDADRRRGT